MAVDIRMLGGTRVLAAHYQFSHIRALKALYPAHEWLPWRFVATSRSHFASRENRLLFFDWAARQLQVSQLSDWYRVHSKQIDELAGDAFLASYYNGSLANALRDCFPVRLRRAVALPVHPWLTLL